jgi:hypothetical protein
MRNIATLDAAPIRDPEGLQSTDCVYEESFLQVISLPHFDAQMKGLECAPRLGFVPPSVNRNCVTCKVCTCLLIFTTLPLSKQCIVFRQSSTYVLFIFYRELLVTCRQCAVTSASPHFPIELPSRKLHPPHRFPPPSSHLLECSLQASRKPPFCSKVSDSGNVHDLHGKPWGRNWWRPISRTEISQFQTSE